MLSHLYASMDTHPVHVINIQFESFHEVALWEKYAYLNATYHNLNATVITYSRIAILSIVCDGHSLQQAKQCIIKPALKSGKLCAISSHGEQEAIQSHIRVGRRPRWFETPTRDIQ